MENKIKEGKHRLFDNEYIPCQEVGLMGEETEIKHLLLREGMSYEFTSRGNKVILLIRGQVNCVLESYSPENLRAHEMFFVRIGMKCRITATKETLLILIRPGNKVTDKDSAAQAYVNGITVNKSEKDLLEASERALPVLPENIHIQSFATGLLSGIRELTEDYFYTTIKMQEFFFLFGKTYTEQDRSRFFESLDSAEQSFAAFIYQNYKRVSSVKELADMTNYSLSGFEKRFRKIFGQPASQWMTRRKAERIYTEICDTSKSFKELSHEYGFSSPAHFSRFCMNHFGKSPLLIRRSDARKLEDI